MKFIYFKILQCSPYFHCTSRHKIVLQLDGLQAFYQKMHILGIVVTWPMHSLNGRQLPPHNLNNIVMSHNTELINKEILHCYLVARGLKECFWYGTSMCMGHVALKKYTLYPCGT
jgi:hypothetical protein